MSGYRQSGFDPDAFAQPGGPLRPFNWVQWIGVAMLGAGLVVTLLHLAGLLGWINPLFDRTAPIAGLPVIGMLLINSRRQASSLVSPEQRARNRRMLVVTLIVCAVVIGGAALIAYMGAR